MSLARLNTCVFICLSVFARKQAAAQNILLVGGSGFFYTLDTTTCSIAPLSAPACGSSSAAPGYYSDALYKDTLYFNTADGILYRSILGDNASCTELRTGVSANAMTVDDNGLLFWVEGGDELFRYDPHNNTTDDLGTINYSSGGDLIFYQKSLIMSSNASQLINVNIDNPGQSTVFMNTPGYLLYGLASFASNCSQNTILGFTGAEMTDYSDIIEIDMTNKTIVRELCSIPLGVLDAASVYEYGGYGLSSTIFPAADTTLCKGTSIVLDAGNAGAGYLWSNNSTDETQTVNASGTYWVTVTAGGCIASDTITCNFITGPVVGLPRDTALCMGDELILDANFPNTNYLWQDGSSLPTYKVTQTGVYSVTATNACGSINDTSSVVFENCNCKFYLPTAFTPNHDGINDIFLPRYTCLLGNNIHNYSMRVYNRWGQVVFTSTNVAAGWDGYAENQLSPVGGYAWEINYDDNATGRHFHQDGTLVLIR